MEVTSDPQESHMFDQQTKSIADSVILLAIARLSMALSLPAIGFVSWLGVQWLDQKFEAQDSKIVAQSLASTNQNTLTTTRIETLERSTAAKIETAEKVGQTAILQTGQINDRLIAVETKQAQDSASAERFQNATLQRLDRMQDSIVSMSNGLAALTAVLQQQSQGHMMDRQRP